MVLAGGHILPPPCLPELDNEGVLAYRLQYHKFRAGEHAGAKGEVTEVLKADTGSDAGSDDDDFDDDFGRGDSVLDIHAAINEFRISYRRYRKGESEGAKGEITDLSYKMTARDARSLPVSQLAESLRAQQAPKRPEAEHPTEPYHVHVGAGRLFIGLVLPALQAAGNNYAILQRASESWAPLGEVDSIAVTVNGDYVVPKMALVTENKDGDGGSMDSGLGNSVSLSSALELDIPIMACVDMNSQVAAELVKRATSFSTSLGPGLSDTMVPLLTKFLPKNENGSRYVPVLYAFENDHASVDKLAEELEERVHVVGCMVDRICVKRSITHALVSVEAEPYKGEIVVLVPPEDSMPPPLKGSHVQIPRLQAQAEYFTQRKLVTVNGMHTTLAFLTLVKMVPEGGLQGDGWKDFSLLTHAAGTKEEKSRMWLWVVARLLFLTWQHEPRIIKEAHKVTSDKEVCDLLLTYGKSTLQRFDTVQDKAGRVLGGGVANRWNGRLKAIQDWLTSEPSMTKGLKKMILTQAGVKESDVRNEIKALVNESQRFVGVSSVKPTKVVVT